MMREIDHALARAFALKGSKRPTSKDETRQASPPVPPSPHFASSFTSASFETPSGPFEWPSLILGLEQQYGDRYAKLADTLIQGRDYRSILLTSTQRAEGRTTLVLSMAREFARRPGRTLIVDADLDNPMIARRLSIRPEVGLDDVVLAGASIRDAIIDSPTDPVSLLTLREAVSRPLEFIRHPRWASLLSQLRREFDRILIDNGPVFARSSVLVPRQPLDAVVMVRNRILTDARRLRRSRHVVEAGGYSVVGLAETFVS